MRLILLLHPGYTFPHSMESFPLDSHVYRWLDKDEDNKLVIIGSCQLQLPKKYEEKIIYYAFPYDHNGSFFATFQYRLRILYLLKKFNNERVLFVGMNTFLFFLKKHFLAFLFEGLIRKNFSIVNYGDAINSYPLFAEHILEMPEIPSSVYDRKNEKECDQIKEELTGGSEYFLCSASFTAPSQVTILLKAYSIFKQRLKTNFKLVLSGISQQDKRFITLLTHYKYRNDVIILSEDVVFSFSSLLSAAYAHICPSFDLFYPCSRADYAAARVPVIYPVEPLNEFTVPEGLTFIVGDIQDLAQKMMQIYKDETTRKQIIQKNYECMQHQQNGFDFSSYL